MDDKTPSPSEVWKTEYVALREEIKQSIDKQHQILIGGYGFSVTVAGLVISAKSVTETHEFPAAALLVIPFALIAMTALWTVEANRMVRASYYLAYRLWPKFTAAAGITESLGWEGWIRCTELAATDFRIRQHRMQLLVTLAIPVMASIACVAISWFFVPPSRVACVLVRCPALIFG